LVGFELKAIVKGKEAVNPVLGSRPSTTLEACDSMRFPGQVKACESGLRKWQRWPKSMLLRLPGFDLHQLKGDRRGTWSIKISGNWRLTFVFKDGDAYDVALEDYH
jgi:hypothetical protein